MSQISSLVSITSDTSGFCVFFRYKKLTKKSQVLWADVVLVFAYKKDCFASDEIRVVIQESSQKTIELSETDEGFEEFVAMLNLHLPIVEEGWHQQLIERPVFDHTALTLFRRA